MCGKGLISSQQGAKLTIPLYMQKSCLEIRFDQFDEFKFDQH